MADIACKCGHLILSTVIKMCLGICKSSDGLGIPCHTTLSPKSFALHNNIPVCLHVKMATHTQGQVRTYFSFKKPYEYEYHRNFYSCWIIYFLCGNHFTKTRRLKAVLHCEFSQDSAWQHPFHSHHPVWKKQDMKVCDCSCQSLTFLLL